MRAAFCGIYCHDIVLLRWEMNSIFASAQLLLRVAAGFAFDIPENLLETGEPSNGRSGFIGFMVRISEKRRLFMSFLE